MGDWLLAPSSSRLLVCHFHSHPRGLAQRVCLPFLFVISQWIVSAICSGDRTQLHLIMKQKDMERTREISSKGSLCAPRNLATPYSASYILGCLGIYLSHHLSQAQTHSPPFGTGINSQEEDSSQPQLLRHW